MVDLTLIERAFQIADEAMYELLESEGVPGDEHRTVFGIVDETCQEVNSLAEASPAMQEAVEWLSQRGYVEIATDGTGEFVQVNTRPGDDGYAGVPSGVPPSRGGEHV